MARWLDTDGYKEADTATTLAYRCRVDVMEILGKAEAE